MNKKAFNFTDAGMLFLSFALIMIFIFIGISLFYSNVVDVRIIESKILSDKLMNIVLVNNLDNSNILDIANLDKNIIENGNYYFKISFLSDDIEVKDSIIIGNRIDGLRCESNEKLSKIENKIVCDVSEDNPGCCLRQIDNNGIKIKILTSVD